MAQVTICVSGRNYKMACRDGEEKRVLELAAIVEEHVKEIKGGLKLVQEERLFLMTALMLADQLHEAREELQRTARQLADLRAVQIIDAARPVETATATIERLNPKAARAAGG